MKLPSLRVLNPFTESEIYRHGCRSNVIVSPLRETYSQYGEDLIIGSVLEVMCRRAGIKSHDIRYVDIGANHPIEISNTYLFYRVCGGSGVLFEADPERIPELKRVRQHDTVVHSAITASHEQTVTLHVANASECSSIDLEQHKLCQGAELVGAVKVPNMHVADAFERYWPGDNTVLLSIDIEGHDLEVVKAIDFTKYRPWIVCVEVSPRGFGTEMVALMKAAGYVLLALTSDNHVFVERSRFDG